MSNKHTVMVVAGGQWQVPIVRKASQMGYRVINSNLYLDSPAFNYADVELVADVLDKKKNMEFAMSYQPDAIVTDQSDIAVPIVAYLCEKLGLPGIGIEMAELFTNKYLMRKICSAHGYPNPKYRLCKSIDEVCDFALEFGYPFILKPPKNQASRGVVKIESGEQVESGFLYALSCSSNGSVLAEEFIPGIELTVDGIKLPQRHYCLTTSCKDHFKHNSMLANRLLFSHSHPDIDYKALHKQHNELMLTMGLPFGLTHAEYKFYDGRFYLIEVAGRGGGSYLSSHIVPLMSGIDSTSFLIRMALGEQIHSLSPVYPKRVAVMDFFDFAPGKVIGIDGLNKAERLPGVVNINVNVAIGESIQPASDDSQRHGHVIAYASDSLKLQNLLEKVGKTVKIRYA